MVGIPVRTGLLVLLVVAAVVSVTVPAAAQTGTGGSIRTGGAGTHVVGDRVTLSGTTNLAAGDRLQIEVTSASFGPTDKTGAVGFGGTSGTVTVREGPDGNTWSMEIDTAGWRGDEYIVTIESIETGATATASFTLVELASAPTLSPASPPATTAPLPATTAPATSPAPPAPGFGFLAALLGLGGTARLVHHRYRTG